MYSACSVWTGHEKVDCYYAVAWFNQRVNIDFLALTRPPRATLPAPLLSVLQLRSVVVIAACCR